MDRYGTVIFMRGGKEMADKQKFLAEQLNRCGIITAEDSEIQDWYEQDKKDPCGCEWNIVLHCKEEEDGFRKTMTNEVLHGPDILWMVSEYPKSGKFQNWLEKNQKEKKDRLDSEDS